MLLNTRCIRCNGQMWRETYFGEVVIECLSCGFANYVTVNEKINWQTTAPKLLTT